METSNTIGKQSGKDDSNYVIITDEIGIETAFNSLKEKLSEHSSQCLTFVYATFSKETIPLFKAELLSLEKRFSNVLQVFFIPYKSTLAEVKAKFQKSIEVILNSNINAVMQFYACGSIEMTDRAKHLLRFLGIKDSQITVENSNNYQNIK